MSTDHSPVCTITDGVAKIRLNRARQGNALNLSAARGLHSVVEELHARRDLGAVVLTAGGRQFCVGGDVREMADAANRPAFVHEVAATVHAALSLLRSLPVPVIAAVQGPAAGAGIGLLLAADIVIASNEARFVAAYGAIGLSPDCGVSALLPPAIGPRRAAAFVLTDLTLDAATAADWGLITEYCPAAQVDARVHRTLERIMARPTGARGAAALLLRRGPTSDYAAHLEVEANSIARLSASTESAALFKTFTQPESGAST